MRALFNTSTNTQTLKFYRLYAVVSSTQALSTYDQLIGQLILIVHCRVGNGNRRLVGGYIGRLKAENQT